MNREDRAKQFAPFDALKGLQEELRKREERLTRIQKRELSEEAQAEIGKELIKIRKNSQAEITFYKAGHYVTVCGAVKEYSVVYKYLVVEEEKIFFDDITELKVLE